ncbi:small redox-active disulfide protein 2 [Orenia metallireducens]|uniref:Small redox-active disulfide protein 2 n=1 Tax=Orenia metallireducens TaxID=1413210 RepID=A0A285HHF3_9FIRM|nr:thioredoxin family protein [Orenia metallireducens]PRX27182.1 small redox-active disulfide protein 2 [Orenia metallireducens]SNY35180.1 small redox-active disulfide protein 2 [Orenia metallireducens]
MKITVYGPGCTNCVTLADHAQAAAKELGLDVEIEKVEDFAEIAKAGIMNTPGLAIDGQVKVKGRVPSIEKIKELLK